MTMEEEFCQSKYCFHYSTIIINYDEIEAMYTTGEGTKIKLWYLLRSGNKFSHPFSGTEPEIMKKVSDRFKNIREALLKRQAVLYQMEKAKISGSTQMLDMRDAESKKNK